MKRRLARVAKWVGYPLFYLGCLLLFIYATFPFDQLRDRIVAEFDKQQAKAKRRPGEQPMKLQIDELDGYWVTGVELTGVRLLIPPEPERPGAKKPGFGGFAGGGDEKKEEAPPKPAELLIDHATARVQLWSLLAGDVKIDFDAEAFGGTLEGTVPAVAGAGAVDVKFEGVQLGQIEPLEDMLEGIPVFGLASGEVQLTPREQKFSKADGRIDIQIAGLKLGKKIKNDEGQVEDVVAIQGMSVPSIQAGTLVIQGDVVNGLLTFSEFTGRGRDFEVLGEGKLKLSDVWDRSTIDAFIKFKFTDAYRGSSDATIALLGKPGASGRPLVEMPGSPLGRAKAGEGFYRFQLKGPLGRLKPRPAGMPGGNTKRSTGSSSKRPKLPRARPKITKRPAPLVDRRDKDREEEEEEENHEEERDDERRASPTLRTPRAASPVQRLRRPEPAEEEQPQDDGDPGAEADEAEGADPGDADGDGAADDGSDR